METELKVSVARMEERLDRLLGDASDAKAWRERQNIQMDEVKNRLYIVETQLASAAPTLAEFVVIKHKINGAGTLGKWLWATGGFLIGAIAIAKTNWNGFTSWFTGN